MPHTSSETQSPRVSIGMPVYNGENFIREALDSILNQTFQDFEVVIADNASTDQTEAICKAYAARDSRIRYYRNKENLGATRNYNLVFELSTGTYFKWAAHDDVIAPDFLEKCLAVLDKDPSVVVCAALTGSIGEKGELLRVLHHSMRLDSQNPHERFFDLLCYPNREAIFGLICTNALRNTNLMGDFSDADGSLLIELSLAGRLVELPEVLFFLRNHPEISTRAHRSARERALWFDPRKAGKFHFPAWRRLSSYYAALRSASLKLSDRVQCHFHLLKWMGMRWKVLAGELKSNLKMALS